MRHGPNPPRVSDPCGCAWAASAAASPFHDAYCDGQCTGRKPAGGHHPARRVGPVWNALRPMGDPHFAALRPSLSEGGGTPLGDGFFALHPELSGLAPLWQSGELAFRARHLDPLPRQAQPFRRGKTCWKPGSQGMRPWHVDGWLNRALTLIAGQHWAAHLPSRWGASRMLILDGDAPINPLAARHQAGNWPASAAAAGLPVHPRPAFRGSRADRAGDGAARRAWADAPRGPAGEVLARYLAEQACARRTRIASAVALGLRHALNGKRLACAQLCATCKTTLLTLRAELGPLWRAQPRPLLAMTSNSAAPRAKTAPAATDHGTGGAMLLCSAVRLNGGRNDRRVGRGCRDAALLLPGAT